MYTLNTPRVLEYEERRPEKEGSNPSAAVCLGSDEFPAPAICITTSALHTLTVYRRLAPTPNEED